MPVCVLVAPRDAATVGRKDDGISLTSLPPVPSEATTVESESIRLLNSLVNVAGRWFVDDEDEADISAEPGLMTSSAGFKTEPLLMLGQSGGREVV